MTQRRATDRLPAAMRVAPRRRGGSCARPCLMATIRFTEHIHLGSVFATIDGGRAQDLPLRDDVLPVRSGTVRYWPRSRG